jgi:hypothetical protein
VTIALPEAATAKMEAAQLAIDDGELSFGPAVVRAENNDSAMIQANYSMLSRAVAVKISTQHADISLLRSAASRLLGPARIPMLESCDQGTWSGWIGFVANGDAAGRWSGAYELENAQMNLPELVSPLRVASATVGTQFGRVHVSRFRARVGDVRLEGDYRFDPESKEAPRLTLSIPELDLRECERLVMPLLDRNQGLLARLRIRGTVMPDWLAQRSLAGTVEVQSVIDGERRLGSLHGNLSWEAANLQLTHLRWILDDAHGEGTLAVNLGGPVPEYHVSGKVEDLDYRDGSLDLEGTLTTSGTGLVALSNTRAEGSFAGRDISLTPETTVQEVAGRFRLAWPAPVPRLMLDKVLLTQASETFTGQGVSQPDGSIVFELNSGSRQVRYVASGFGPETSAEPLRQRP